MCSNFNASGAFWRFQRNSFSWFKIIERQTFCFKYLFIFLNIINVNQDSSIITVELFVTVTGKLEMPPKTPVE